jgi:endonuclease YncB( thermonuclease family)
LLKEIPMSRTLIALAAVVLALGAVPAARAGSQPLMTVAAGDSYASGEGAIGANWTNAACHRSNLAGPRNAAGRLAVLRVTGFLSVACSGATSSTVLGQLGALPAGRIDALSISMGGNDIGFASVVGACIATHDCRLLDASVSASLTLLPGRLASVLNAVPARVGNVFVTEYPDPTTGLFGVRCGNPFSPGFQGFDGISEFEAAWASSRVVGRLNAALAAAVTAANARPGSHPVFQFVTGISSRFATHGYCTGGGSPFLHVWPHPRFVATPVDSRTSQGDFMGSMHPNDLGQIAIGEALFAAERFLADPLALKIKPATTPVVGAGTTLAITVSTSAGTPVPDATVRIDGVDAGKTDQTGVLTRNWTFGTTGAHTISVDHDPYPAKAVTLGVIGKEYTVSTSPSPVPVGASVALTPRATDAAGQLLPGTFTLTSGAGTAQIASGATATVSLTMRYRYEWEEGTTGKPEQVKIPVCPGIQFQPDNPVFDPKDASGLVGCES